MRETKNTNYNTDLHNFSPPRSCLVLKVREEWSGHLSGLTRVLEQVVEVVEGVEGGVAVRGVAPRLHVHESFPENKEGTSEEKCLATRRAAE